MTQKGPEHDGSRIVSSTRSILDRRRFIAVGGGLGATLFAGCTSETPSTDGADDDSTDDSGDSSGGNDANFRLLVSDRPADIGDFDRLDVAFDTARIFDGGSEDESDGADDGEAAEDGGNETAEEGGNETDDDGTPDETPEEETPEADAADDAPDEEHEDEHDDHGNESTGTGGEDDGEAADDGSEDDEGVERRRGFYVLDLDGETVDLTQVVGERATAVFEGGLSEGTYNKLELHVAAVEGIVDGEEAEVKVPSEKLQITKPFEIGGEDPVDFVFDINVVKRGQGDSYNLKPVISESGVAGEDVEVEEVGDDADEGESDETDGEDDVEDGGEGEAGEGGDEGDDTADGDDDGRNESDDGTGGNESAAGNESDDE